MKGLLIYVAIGIVWALFTRFIIYIDRDDTNKYDSPYSRFIGSCSSSDIYNSDIYTGNYAWFILVFVWPISIISNVVVFILLWKRDHGGLNG